MDLDFAASGAGMLEAATGFKLARSPCFPICTDLWYAGNARRCLLGMSVLALESDSLSHLQIEV